jgi:hypothetical protein
LAQQEEELQERVDLVVLLELLETLCNIVLLVLQRGKIEPMWLEIL